MMFIYQVWLPRPDNSGTLLHTRRDYTDDRVDAVGSLYERVVAMAEEELYQGSADT
jgi:hypothetical protein